MLTAYDPLPRRPCRVTVAGVSGSGKTTLTRRVAGLLDLPYTEMDALFHGPGWTPRPTFGVEVDAVVSGDRWATEWQYDYARPLIAARADLLVWLDVPFPVVLGRVVRRTVRRRIRRERLWNGNQEAPLHTFLTDPEHVVRWSISTRHLYRERVPALEAAYPHLKASRCPAVLNVVSVGGLRPGPFIGAYNVGKAALTHLTKQLAMELAPDIRVNAIAPGLVKTSFARALWEPNEEGANRMQALGRVEVGAQPLLGGVGWRDGGATSLCILAADGGRTAVRQWRLFRRGPLL